MSIADLHRRIPGIEEVPLIGILRRIPIGRVLGLVQSAADAGLRVVEVTLDSPSALDTISGLVEGAPDMTIGVGSARDDESVKRAVQAGARFVVSPVVSESVAAVCKELDVPHLPGAATPTEIHNALLGGATAVKVFPADQLGGPPFLQAVRSPLGEPPLVPTGGVTLDNASTYLQAGACAVGVGSGLFPPDVAEAAAGRVREHVEEWIEAVTQ